MAISIDWTALEPGRYSARVNGNHWVIFRQSTPGGGRWIVELNGSHRMGFPKTLAAGKKIVKRYEGDRS